LDPTIHKKYTEKTKQEQRQRQTTNKQPKRKSQIMVEITVQDAFFHFFSMLLNGAYASKFETGWEP
jgi:hypothetical protein